MISISRLLKLIFILLSVTTTTVVDVRDGYTSCRKGLPFYFSEFDPARGLRLDEELNYEEVYRNYEFYEVFFNDTCDLITVNRYVGGSLKSADRFRIKDDNLIKE